MKRQETEIPSQRLSFLFRLELKRTLDWVTVGVRRMYIKIAF